MSFLLMLWTIWDWSKVTEYWFHWEVNLGWNPKYRSNLTSEKYWFSQEAISAAANCALVRAVFNGQALNTFPAWGVYTVVHRPEGTKNPENSNSIKNTVPCYCQRGKL